MKDNQERRRHSEKIQDDNAVHIGRMLIAYRKKAGLTQEQLAERLGTDPDVLSSYERGLTVMRVNTLVSYLEAVGANEMTTVPILFPNLMDSIAKQGFSKLLDEMIKAYKEISD